MRGTRTVLDSLRSLATSGRAAVSSLPGCWLLVLLPACGDAPAPAGDELAALVAELARSPGDPTVTRRLHARLGDDPVMALAGFLAHSDSAVRGWAARGLRDFGAAAVHAAPALMRAVVDDDRSTARAAVTALIAIGEPALPQLVAALGDADERRRDCASGVLLALGASAVPALCDALRDSDARLRLEACSALREIAERRRLGDASIERAIDALAGALGDADARVRAWAALALGAADADGRCAQRLARLSGDADPGVREAAADAMRRIRVRRR